MIESGRNLNIQIVYIQPAFVNPLTPYRFINVIFVSLLLRDKVQL